MKCWLQNLELHRLVWIILPKIIIQYGRPRKKRNRVLRLRLQRCKKEIICWGDRPKYEKFLKHSSPNMVTLQQISSFFFRSVQRCSSLHKIRVIRIRWTKWFRGNMEDNRVSISLQIQLIIAVKVRWLFSGFTKFKVVWQWINCPIAYLKIHLS